MEFLKKRPLNLFRHFGFTVSLVVLLGCLISFLFSGLLSYSNVGIQPGEINLSGKWKVALADHSEFKQLEFNDSTWCQIGVPMGFLLPKGSQPAPCQDFWYDRAKFRNATFWYRKTFYLDSPTPLNEPSLFLGATKGRAQVYLNGQRLGLFKKEDSPINILFNDDLLNLGKNVLSVRVESGAEDYPGIHHAYDRGVVIGEYENNIQAKDQMLVVGYFRPFISFIISIFCLSILLVVMYLYRGSLRHYQWLALYFGGGVLHGQGQILAGYLGGMTTQIRLINDFSLLALIFGTVGFGLTSLTSKRSWREQFEKWILSFLLLSVAIHTLGFFFPETLFSTFKWGLQWFTVSAGFLALSVATLQILGPRDKEIKVSTENLIKLVAMLVVSIYSVLGYLVLPHHRFLQEFSLVSASLSIVIIFVAVREYLHQDRALSFFGRFVRPGLRTMLQTLGDKVYSDQKVFRGRQVPVVKIDIVNHTRLTYSMPYGLKRLFQDLWYSRVDACFQAISFVDKNVGDGSIYCIREKASSSPCLTALQTVVDIRDRHVPEFWKEFRHRVDLLVEAEPELKGPYQQFLKRYRERYEEEFWDHDFKIYASLVYGFVDEGLWGLLGQSHYDVQGDLITLAARLESAAMPNEILIDEKFYARLEEETDASSENAFRWRYARLKGLGQYRIGTLESLLAIQTQTEAFTLATA